MLQALKISLQGFFLGREKITLKTFFLETNQEQSLLVTTHSLFKCSKNENPNRYFV